MRSLIFLSIFFIFSCTNNSTTHKKASIPKCADINKNEILKNSPWDSKEYFNEMTNLLYKEKNVRFYYDGRIMKNGATFFIVRCVGKDFCGDIFLYLGEGDSNSEILLLDDSEGAELIGLQYHMEDLKYKLHFIYDSVEEIRK